MKFSYQKRIMLTAVALTIALLLIAAALWMPQIPRKVDILNTLFVLDITDSMNVEDATLNNEPINRLDWAKNYTRQAIREMPCGSKAGLAIFSEARSLILMNPVEVCSSYHDLLQMLSQVDQTMAWARSSEVSKAVYTAIRQTEEIDSHPAVVMLTDGHESPPIDESLFPKFTGKPGDVPGVLIGIGGEDLLPIPKTNAKGEIEGVWGVNDVMHTDVYASYDSTGNSAPQSRTEHLSSQKKAHLDTLANRVGFSYLASPKKPSELIDTLLDISEPKQTVVDYDPYVWLSFVALVLMLLSFFPYSLLRHKQR